MTDKIIVIDCLGADAGPEVVIKGIADGLKEVKDISYALVGPKSLIEAKLKELNADTSRVEIVDASETITNFENPMNGIMSKPNASLVKALKLVGSDEKYIGLITAGSSGAILVGSVRFLLDEKRTRPCMAAILPNALEAYTCVVDTGASIDVDSYQLHEFAKLGSDFMKKLYKIDNPKVGLLSNGAEKTKGNKLVKETYPLLEADETLNFVGNIEGNKALSGDCDVLVCDGFAGNQVLKNTEGMAKNLITDIVKYSKKNNRPEFMEVAQYLMAKYDISSLGGAFVLGARKTVVKARGNSNEKTFANLSRMLFNYHEGTSIYKNKYLK